MKKALTILLILLATTASAQFWDNSMGIFYSDVDFLPEQTNWNSVGAPFDAYVVLVNPTMSAVGAYEVGIEVSDPAVFVLNVTGPNGWTTYGDPLNHLVGYTTPLVVQGDGVVLSTMTFLYTGVEPVNISFGPSVPSSVDDAGPAIADGFNPDILYVCTYTSGQDLDGLVATINGNGIDGGGCPAVEARSYSCVKNLFQ